MRMRDTLERLASQRATAWSTIATVHLSDFALPAENPGGLTARAYIPADLAAGAALVVVLHGCTQTAEGLDAGTGWSQLADRAGFALLFPEQRRANNPNLCFNWFQLHDVSRVGGEAESIAAMAEAMIDQHQLDRGRVFVTGLSAGGAMAGVMLATYPDVFAGGAIIGGLPYGCADGVGQALARMAGRGGDVSATDGADAVLRAPGITPDRWPTVSIWHGTADLTVVAGNMEDLAMQWRRVHGVDRSDDRREDGPNWERRRWDDGDRTVVETWLISGMGHGVPIDPAGPEALGSAGPYMLPVGIDSTSAIARSWGLLPELETGAALPPAANRRSQTRAKTVPLPAAIPGPVRAPGIQGVIEDALRSAGLMK